ncbi:MAG: hypothetical protein ACI9FD_000723 [Gammaproteobacteria bacterium]
MHQMTLISQAESFRLKQGRKFYPHIDVLQQLLLSLVFLLSSCITTVVQASDFVFDFSTAKPSDFNGYWNGPVKCSHTGNWSPPVEITIKYGIGTLASFGNWGNPVTADLNLSSGKIKWKGKYDNRNGNPNSRYSLKGKWMGNKFKVRGARGGVLVTPYYQTTSLK